MDSRKLRHAVILADEKSYALAANKLRITQPALTKSIQALEAELGVKLFDRSRSGTQLTRTGEYFVREARSLLRQMNILEQDMSRLARGEAGEIDLGAGPLPASLLLPHVLARIARDHSLVRFRSRVGHAAELLQALRDGELDLAVVAYPFLQDGADALATRRIGTVELAPLVRRNHPLTTGASTDPSAFPTIGGSVDPLALPAPVLDYSPSMTCENFEIVRQVVLHSDAIWITAKCMAGEDLVILKGTGLPEPQGVSIGLAWLARRSLSPTALLCMELMQEAMAAAQPPASRPSPRFN